MESIGTIVQSQILVAYEFCGFHTLPYMVISLTPLPRLCLGGMTTSNIILPYRSILQIHHITATNNFVLSYCYKSSRKK